MDLRPGRFKTWDNQVDPETLVWTIKLDGVMAVKTPEGIISRNGKPLYNIPDFDGEVAEVFLGDFDASISAVHTHNGTLIDKQNIYTLFPTPDPRLIVHGKLEEVIKEVFQKGYEGLVLRDDVKRIYYKIKLKETHDIKVTGLIEGTGKYIGMLGAFKTEKGNVGTGFTDVERRYLYTQEAVGRMIEVECMQLTKDGKFRHPRFIRLRPDKS